MADAPSLASAGGLQDRVAEAAEDQGLRYQMGGIVFDQENGLRTALRELARLACVEAGRLVCGWILHLRIERSGRGVY
jgi:hypothetical protein